MRATFLRDTGVAFSCLAMLTWVFCLTPANGTPADPYEPKLLHTLKGWSKGLAFSPDGETIAGSWMPEAQSEKDISLWDVASGKKTVILKGHSGLVAFHPNGKTLASGGRLGSIKLWDVATAYCSASLDANLGDTESLVFSPDGKFLATAGIDFFAKQRSTVAVWDASTLKNALELERQPGGVKTLAFSPDGKLLACAGRDEGRIVIWQIDSGKVRYIIHEDKRAFIYCLAFSPEGKTLAAASHRMGIKSPSLVSADLDGSSDHDVKLWDVGTGELAVALSGHRGAIVSVAFSPDGRMLASSSDDKTIRLWDLATRRSIATLETKRFVINLAFSSNGRYLAAASSADRSVTLWGLPPPDKQ